MGMCKQCKEVFSALEMKNGMCIACLENNPELQKEKQEAKHIFKTSDNRVIGAFAMLVGAGLITFSLNKLGGSALGVSFVAFGTGVAQWFGSNRPFVVIYEDYIELGDMEIKREDIEKIENEKKNINIFLKDDTALALPLNRVSPATRDEMVKVVEEFFNE